MHACTLTTSCSTTQVLTTLAPSATLISMQYLLDIAAGSVKPNMQDYSMCAWTVAGSSDDEEVSTFAQSAASLNLCCGELITRPACRQESHHMLLQIMLVNVMPGTCNGRTQLTHSTL
jgi:hypothetical protein